MNPTILSADQVQKATAEQLNNVITNVSNTQRYLGLNNAKEDYKHDIVVGNLRDGFTHLFGAIPYESYGFFDGTLSTTVDRFANVFKELYDFYLENNRENNREEIQAEKTSLVTFILKVSDFTNDRLRYLEESEEYQGLLAEWMVNLLMDIIIKTGTFYNSITPITPVDINVIMYHNEYFRNERFSSLRDLLMLELNHQRVLDDFHSRTGQPSLLFSMGR